MKILIDISYLTFKWAMATARWDWLEEFMKTDVVFAFDDERNVRMETYPWYKANRGAALPPVTQQLRKMAKKFQGQIEFFHPERCVRVDGAEGDDILGMLALENPGSILVSEDHDMLQLPDAALVNQHMVPWDVDRMWKYTKLPLKRGRSFLAYQLMYGCHTDTVPRRLLTKDLYTGPWVMSQSDPLTAAMAMLPEQQVRDSLDCLLIPSPLLTGNDPIEQALALPL